MASYRGLNGTCDVCGQADYFAMKEAGYFGIDGHKSEFLCPNCVDHLLDKYIHMYGADVFKFMLDSRRKKLESSK